MYRASPSYVTKHDLSHYKYTELSGLAVFFTWVFTLAFSIPTSWETFYWLLDHGIACCSKHPPCM
jgi:hypothetical protein